MKIPCLTAGLVCVAVIMEVDVRWMKVSCFIAIAKLSTFS
jgi:hypothetical protein